MFSQPPGRGGGFGGSSTGSNVSLATQQAKEKVRIAETEISQKRWAHALDSLNDALMKDPKLIEGYVVRSRVFYVLGQADNAISDIERAMNLDPEGREPAVLLQLAHLHMAEGQHSDAQIAIEGALETNPQHRDLQHVNTVLHFTSNEFFRAACGALELLKSGESTPEILASCATIFTSSVEALLSMERQEELRQLMIDQENATSGNAMVGDRTKHVPVMKELVEVGQKHFDKSNVLDFEQARYIWEACRLVFSVLDETEMADATANKLAQVYTALGRPDRAKLARATREKTDPLDTGAAEDEFASGNYALAISKYEEALAHVDALDFATRARLHLKLGEVYFAVANLPTAITNLKESCRMAADSNDEGRELELLAQNELARCLILQRDLKGARAALQRALELHAMAYQTMSVANAVEKRRLEFVDMVKATHSTAGELALVHGDAKSAMEWFQRAQSFSLIDSLGEVIAREGAADVVQSEIAETIRAAGADMALSYFRASTNQYHAFLVTPADGGRGVDVTYKAVSWPTHLQMPPEESGKELRVAAGVSEPKSGQTDVVQTDAQGDASHAGVATSALGPRRTLRFRATTKAVEAAMDAAERRARTAAEKAKTNSDKVKEDERRRFHELYVTLITPFNIKELRLLDRSPLKKVQGPIKTVISCDETLFMVPWHALVDPHDGHSLFDTIDILTLTSCFAQLRHSLHLSAAIQVPNPQVAVVRDSSIPLWSWSPKRATDGEDGGDSGDGAADAKPSASPPPPESMALSKPVVTVDCNADRAMRGLSATLATESLNMVHIKLRYTNRDMLGPNQFTLHEDSLTKETLVECKVNEKAQQAWAQGAVKASEDLACDAGWLFANVDSAAKSIGAGAVPVATKGRSLAVADVASLALPNANVTLDLEGNTKDVSQIGTKLVRNLLAAGAHCVVVPQWTMEQEARDVFYSTFYSEVQVGSPFAAARAARELVADRYSSDPDSIMGDSGPWRDRFQTSAHLWGSFMVYM